MKFEVHVELVVQIEADSDDDAVAKVKDQLDDTLKDEAEVWAVQLGPDHA